MDRALKQIEPLNVASLNLDDAWRKWRRRFEIYLVAMKANKLSEEEKCAILLHSILQNYDRIMITSKNSWIYW